MKNKESGFTLLELMITMGVVAIIASLSIGSFQGAFERNAVRTEADAALHMIKLARSEAIKRSGTVSVSAPAGWDGAWSIFNDDSNGGDNNGVMDNDEEVLFDKRAPKTAINISRSEGGAFFSFASTGFRNGADDVILSFCDPTGMSDGFMVTVSTVGQVIKTEVEAASC